MYLNDEVVQYSENIRICKDYFGCVYNKDGRCIYHACKSEFRIPSYCACNDADQYHDMEE